MIKTKNDLHEYLSCDKKDLCKEFRFLNGINQKDWKSTLISFAKSRKRIETLFSQLTDQFMVIRNYAKITNGLFAKIIGKISALTALQYINCTNNKPIGRIKYALT